NLKSESKRDEIVVQACNESKVLAPLVLLIRALFERNKGSFETTSPAALERLTQIAAARLAKASKSGELIDHSMLVTLTFSWSNWVDVQVVKEAVMKMMQQEPCFWKIMVTVFQGLPDIDLDELLEPAHFHNIDLPGLKQWFDQFTDPVEVNLRIDRMDASCRLTDRQKLIAQCFKQIFVKKPNSGPNIVEINTLSD
ncbi:MAG: hypothetical protein K2X81_25525, partial [Candidatus Obscuribacterales bacterium]|nr:hypothetical protein [Candidatus Obscuribacterales bacterium]